MTIDIAVSTGEGPAEPVLGDLIEDEYRRERADYDDGPGHQEYDPEGDENDDDEVAEASA